MSFHARPRHPLTGRRFHLHARSKRELDAYLHRLDSLRSDLRLGVRSPEQVDRELRYLQHGPATLERACVAYLERPAIGELTRGRVRRAMRNHLATLLPMPLAALDAPCLSAWVTSMQRAGLWDTTIATEWRTLRMVVRTALERGWIGALPWGAWRPSLSSRPKRAPREAARSYQELACLLYAARELDQLDRRIAPTLVSSREPKIACAALLGVRQGELAGLRWPDIDWGPPLRVLIARQWGGRKLKNSAPPAIVESLPELGAILRRYRDHLEACGLYDAKGPLFPSPRSPRGEPRAYAQGEVLTRLELRSAVERAQLPALGAWSAHSLRDSFVTLEALASGGDLARVALRSRHGSVATLTRYLRAVTRNPSPAAPGLPARVLGAAGEAPIAQHAPRTEK